MKKRNISAAATVLALAVVLSVLLPAIADARPAYLAAWEARYPDSTIPTRMAAQTGSSCNTCHHPPARSLPGTCYREDIKTLILGGATIEQALTALENEDSDLDGVTNIVEINYVRSDLPGEVGFHPGLIGETGTDPCGNDPGEVVTGQRETHENPASVSDDLGRAVSRGIAVFPNPAPAGETQVAFRMPGDMTIEVSVFDISGRVVRTLAAGSYGEGTRTAAWDGRDASGCDVPPGVYYVRLFGITRTPISEPVIVLR